MTAVIQDHVAEVCSVSASGFNHHLCPDHMRLPCSLSAHPSDQRDRGDRLCSPDAETGRESAGRGQHAVDGEQVRLGQVGTGHVSHASPVIVHGDAMPSDSSDSNNLLARFRSVFCPLYSPWTTITDRTTAKRSTKNGPRSGIGPRSDSGNASSTPVRIRRSSATRSPRKRKSTSRLSRRREG